MASRILPAHRPFAMLAWGRQPNRSAVSFPNMSLADVEISRVREYWGWRPGMFWKSAAASAPTRSTLRGTALLVTSVDLSERSLELACRRWKSTALRIRLSFIVQRRRADQLRSRRAMRSDLFVRSDSPHSTSGPRARGAALVRAAGNVREDHGISPAFVEGAVDPADRKQRPILEAARPGGEELRSARSGSNYLHIFASREPRDPGAQGFRVRNIEVDHSFPCHITDYVEDRYVFPRNARARVPRTRTAFRVALMPETHEADT
jgi:hypothetical protein